MSYRETLAAEHRACDAEFAKVEQAAHAGDWSAAGLAARSFVDQTEHHLRYEEEVLFPALERATPMATGPTSMMRFEHAQMRELFTQLLDAVAGQDAAALADSVETLLLLMQQHNAKEENVLYPIADSTLPPDLPRPTDNQ